MDAGSDAADLGSDAGTDAGCAVGEAASTATSGELDLFGTPACGWAVGGCCLRQLQRLRHRESRSGTGLRRGLSRRIPGWPRVCICLLGMSASVNKLTHLLRLSEGLVARGRYEEAYGLVDSVLEIATLSLKPLMAAKARFARAQCAFMRGDVNAARRDAFRARRELTKLGDHEAAELAHAREVFLAVDNADFEHACALTREPIPMTSVGHAVRMGYVGNLRRATRDYASALRCYDVASQALVSLSHNDGHPSALYAAVFRMDHAITLALMGQGTEALHALRDVRRHLRDEQLEHAHLDALIAHYIRLVARSLHVKPRADEDLLPGHFDGMCVQDTVQAFDRISYDIQSARSTRARKHAASALAKSPLANWDHTRVSSALLDRMVGAVSKHMWIDFDNGVVRFGDGDSMRTIDLRERPSLARLVDCFVDAHSGADAKPLSVQELVARAWPDEKVLPRAALNRLHVAITTLRALGLRDLIRTTRGGYSLAANVRLVG